MITAIGSTSCDMAIGFPMTIELPMAIGYFIMMVLGNLLHCPLVVDMMAAVTPQRHIDSAI